MGRLARAVSGGRSRDIVTDGRLAIIDEPAKEPEQANGPVKTTLDLSCFIKFDGQKSQGRRGKWMSMGVRGELGISHEIGKTLPESAMAEFYLNRKGTILVMRESINGIPLRKTNKSEARKAFCHALKVKLQELGVKLPARFIAEWDAELGAWVGRRE